MKKLIFLIPVLLILAGCAATQVKKADERINSLNSVCNSLMGKTEEEAIITLGAPQNIEKISGLTIYQYQQSHGMRTSGFTTGEFQIWEAIDKFELVFKNGRVVSWTSNVRM